MSGPDGHPINYKPLRLHFISALWSRQDSLMSVAGAVSSLRLWGWRRRTSAKKVTASNHQSVLEMIHRSAARIIWKTNFTFISNCYGKAPFPRWRGHPASWLSEKFWDIRVTRTLTIYSTWFPSQFILFLDTIKACVVCRATRPPWKVILLPTMPW